MNFIALCSHFLKKMKTLYAIFFFLLALTTPVTAQHLNVNWTRFIGPDSCCVGLYNAIPSKDGGIVFTGESDYAGSGDIPASPFAGTVVGKVDSNHNLLWVHVYGGDHGQSICQTPDGGYAILAYTEGVDGYVSGYLGNSDLWLFKIDSIGNFLWGNCYGSINYAEEPSSLALTKDNGFILLGVSNGYGQDVPFHLGGPDEFEDDWFVVKTDSLGNIQWTNDLGGSNDEDIYGSIVTADTGYYLFGTSLSTDYDCIDTAWHSGVYTDYDYYILRLNDTGGLAWAKSFGGSGGEIAANGGGSAVWDNRDNTIVVTGSSSSNDYMVTGNPLGSGMWTIKVNKSGQLVWEKALGGATYGCGGTGIALNNVDSGYVVLGTSGGGFIGSSDDWIFTVDNSCNIIADTIFGGIDGDATAAVFPYSQGYIATGASSSPGFTEGVNLGTIGSGNKYTISYLSCCPNPVSVQNITTVNQPLQIFPNPTNDIVKIILPENGNLIITNCYGQNIYSKNIIEQNLNIKIDNWVKGLYIVQWQGEDGTIQTTKLIVN